MDTHKILKNKRIELGISQVSLARCIGMGTPQQLCNFENGTAPIPLKYLKPLIEFLDISERDIKVMMLDDYQKELNKHLK